MPLATNAAPDADTGPDMGVGSAFVVEPPMAHYLRDLDQREQREQIRDWAVIATVTKLGATPRQAATATYELPPARLPYFDELYAFEYGRGRRAYLGQRVLLFRDGDDPDPQATIGRLADRVRMENGEIPSEVEIYLVHDQRDDGSIRIERTANITGSELFSPAYGYVEGTADNVSTLSTWLGKADDLGFARIDHGRVTLGGRRFANSPTSGLTTEDVAALYQAQAQLDTSRARASATLASLPPGARAMTGRLGKLVESRAPSEDLMNAGYALAGEPPLGMRDAVYDTIGVLTKPAASPGFSLDPQWLPDPSSPQHPLMLRRLRAFSADPCGAIAGIARRADALERAEPDDTRRTARTQLALNVRKLVTGPRWNQRRTSVCPELTQLVSPLRVLAYKVALAKRDAWESELVGYYQLVEQWRDLTPEDPGWVAAGIAISALNFYELESQAHCARYVGTEGTSVGMTMFYTDLLAKLWASIDYGLSSPIVDVPGFRSKPRVELDPAFLPSTRKNPGTRVWFGARATGVSRAVRGNSSSFFFDGTFSRIYAAASNPATPGMEVQPNESSRRTFGWWDRHFEDVASYEPEYQRLNQIMKWALVAGALLESNTAQYLGSVAVRRDLAFVDWQRTNHARLRFSESLPAPHSSPSARECLPSLISYPFVSMGAIHTISGGVDSVPTTALAKVPISNLSLPLGARKPYVDNLVGDNTAARAHPTVSGEDVVFVDPASVSTRTTSGDIALGAPRVAYRAGSAPRAIEIHVGDRQRPIGVLSAEVNGTLVTLRWTDGVVELERYHAPAVPNNLAAADRLAADGDIVTAAMSYQANVAGPPTTANELARDIVVKAAQRRPTAVLNAVQALASQGQQLLPDPRKALFNAVSEVGSSRVAEHLKTALDHGLPLANKHGAISVECGHLLVTRDIERLPVTKMSTAHPTDLSTSEVYLDTRLRVGQDGLVPDTGGPVARWQQRRNVRVEEMKGNAIGVLPDRIVAGTTTKTTYDHVAPSTARTAAASHVIFLRQCDGDHKTATTGDDC
jgi:hypothetical protein